MQNNAKTMQYLDKFTRRKVQEGVSHQKAAIPDSLDTWIAHYLQLVVVGVRSEAVAQKIG